MTQDTQQLLAQATDVAESKGDFVTAGTLKVARLRALSAGYSVDEATLALARTLTASAAPKE